MRRQRKKHQKTIQEVYSVFVDGHPTYPPYTTPEAAKDAIKWMEERRRKHLNATIRPQRVAMWTH